MAMAYGRGMLRTESRKAANLNSSKRSKSFPWSCSSCAGLYSSLICAKVRKASHGRYFTWLQPLDETHRPGTTTFHAYQVADLRYIGYLPS